MLSGDIYPLGVIILERLDDSYLSEIVISGPFLQPDREKKKNRIIQAKYACC